MGSVIHQEAGFYRAVVELDFDSPGWVFAQERADLLMTSWGS